MFEFKGLSNRPVSGSLTELYVDTDTMLLWRWTGSGWRVPGFNAAGTALVGPNGVSGIGRVAAQKPRLAICGASIVNRSSYANSANQDFAPTSWLEWWQALAGQPFQIVSMAGYGGRQVGVVDSNFDSEVGAYTPDVVLLGSDSVVNYLVNAVGATAPLAMGYVESIYNKCVDLGASLFVFSAPPNGNHSAGNDPALTVGRASQDYNRLLQAFASTHAGMVVVPFHAHTDLAAADARYVTTTAATLQGTAWTHDATHPQPKLAIKLAQLLRDTLEPYYPKRILLPHASNSDLLRCLANPLNYGIGGTNGSGNSNTLTGGTATEEARTDIGDSGAWKKISIAAGTANAVYVFTGVGSIPANMTVGVTPIRALVEIKLNAAPTNLRGFKVTLGFAGTTATIGGFNTSEGGSFATLSDAGPYIPVGETLWLSTAIDELPAAATNFSVTLTATKASAGNMTVDFSVGRAIIEPVGTAVPPIVLAQTIP